MKRQRYKTRKARKQDICSTGGAHYTHSRRFDSEGRLKSKGRISPFIAAAKRLLSRDRGS